MTAPYRTEDAVTQVAVVGAGTIGASWITAFLAKGLAVTAVENSAETRDQLRATIARNWIGMEAAGLVASGASPDRLTILSDLRELEGRPIDFVQENVREQLDLKRETLQGIDAVVAPDVIIASSTSGLTASSIQQGCRHPERVLVGHPMNPPHLIPLVEVVGGERTAPGAVDAVIRLYRALGKRPVRLDKEIVGHIVTRLTAALWQEAAFLVDAGVASVEDVDLAVTHGLGLRLAVAGPHMVYHMGGGAGGLAGFFSWARGPLQSWCADLRPVILDSALEAKLVAGAVAAAGGRSIAELAERRDVALSGILRLLHSGPSSS